MIGYCVHPKVAEDLNLKLAQLMLVGSTENTFKSYRNYRLNTVVFHEYYYYTISRYPILSPSRKKHMLRNTYESMHFPNSLGLVEHTSTPFSKTLLPNLKASLLHLRIL
jgi:hypothetical protein